MRGPRWPSELEPIGLWTRHSASVVVGHRRLLARGTASAEAVQRALSVGISLGPGETWITSIRGAADIAELRFRWKADKSR